MKIYFENYQYLTEEDLLEASAKTDFRDKFGQKSLDNFDKAKQRLKNNGMSVDYGQYLKMSQEELDNLILSLYDDKKDAQKKRILQGKDKEIRGKYNYIGEYGGFKIYEPLDYIASMDLGVNTGWCTTGRYGHAGHPEYTPSIEDAANHFNAYTSQGIRLFYFLNPRTMYGEWAVALYPEILYVNEFIGNDYVINANFELFDANDDLNYSGIQELPLNKLKVEIVLDTAKVIDGLAISDSGVLIEVKSESKLKLKSITIPNGVTEIGDYAFSYCSFLESISLPDGITAIGDNAFRGCRSLKSISIPNGVTKIGCGAFDECSALKSISIPNRVTEIGRYTFSECELLESIYIPNSVKEIGANAFSYCPSLKSINIPDGVTKIGDYAFCRCESLKSIYISNSVTEIGVCAFSGCGLLESINIPDSVAKIGDCAFYDCPSLKSVKIPNSIVEIGRKAFSGCGLLESISIPNGVKKIGNDAFYGCLSLKSVSLPKRFSDYRSIYYLGLDWLDKSKIKFT